MFHVLLYNTNILSRIGGLTPGSVVIGSIRFAVMQDFNGFSNCIYLGVGFWNSASFSMFFLADFSCSLLLGQWYKGKAYWGLGFGKICGCCCNFIIVYYGFVFTLIAVVWYGSFVLVVGGLDLCAFIISWTGLWGYSQWMYVDFDFILLCVLIALMCCVDYSVVYTIALKEFGHILVYLRSKY